MSRAVRRGASKDVGQTSRSSSVLGRWRPVRSMVSPIRGLRGRPPDRQAQTSSLASSAPTTMNRIVHLRPSREQSLRWVHWRGSAPRAFPRHAGVARPAALRSASSSSCRSTTPTPCEALREAISERTAGVAAVGGPPGGLDLEHLLLFVIGRLSISATYSWVSFSRSSPPGRDRPRSASLPSEGLEIVAGLRRRLRTATRALRPGACDLDHLLAALRREHGGTPGDHRASLSG